MKSLVLYSTNGQEAALLELAQHSYPGIDDLYCVIRKRMIFNKSGRSYVQLDKSRAAWPLYFLHDIMPQVEAAEHVFVVNSSLRTPMTEMLEYLTTASANLDFFSVNGRSEKATIEGGTISVPDWEACAISSDLLAHPEFRTFMRNLGPDLDEGGKHYAERYFFEHFRKSFAFAISGEKAA